MCDMHQERGSRIDEYVEALVPADGQAGAAFAIEGRFIAFDLPRAQYVTSVCTGAFFLYYSGQLTGRRATTHWNAMEMLRAWME